MHCVSGLKLTVHLSLDLTTFTGNMEFRKILTLNGMKQGRNQSNPEYGTFSTANGPIFSASNWHKQKGRGFGML